MINYEIDEFSLESASSMHNCTDIELLQLPINVKVYKICQINWLYARRQKRMANAIFDDVYNITIKCMA